MPLVREFASRRESAELSRVAFLLVAAAILSGCSTHQRPSEPLASELAAIQCLADHAEHASAMFGKARLTFVCIDKKMAETPSLLRCDPTSRPMTCQDMGSIILSRDAAGVVHGGTLDGKIKNEAPPGPGATNDSQLTLNFSSAPLKSLVTDKMESAWRFRVPSVADGLPLGFSVIQGSMCDRVATALSTGRCGLEVRSPSLYWYISISVRHKQGTPISEEEYRREFAFWLPYLDHMVVDPES